MKLNEALVAVVRQLVEDRGMTYTGLARVSGVSRNSLQNYLTRGRTMPIDVVEEIAEGLGMTTHALMRLAEDYRERDQTANK